MSKSNPHQDLELPDELEMQEEYDFTQAVRGNKYYESYCRSKGKIPVKITSETGDREVYLRKIETKAMITSDGQLTAQIPSDFTPGLHRVTLIIEEDEISSLSSDVSC